MNRVGVQQDAARKYYEDSDPSVLTPEYLLMQMAYRCSVLPFEVKLTCNEYTYQLYARCVRVTRKCVHACADALWQPEGDIGCLLPLLLALFP